MLHPHDRFAPDEEVFRRDELRHRLGEEGLRPEAAARPERESLHPTKQRCIGPDVVHRHLRAVLRASLDGDLNLRGSVRLSGLKRK